MACLYPTGVQWCRVLKQCCMVNGLSCPPVLSRQAGVLPMIIRAFCSSCLPSNQAPLSLSLAISSGGSMDPLSHTTLLPETIKQQYMSMPLRQQYSSSAGPSPSSSRYRGVGSPGTGSGPVGVGGGGSSSAGAHQMYTSSSTSSASAHLQQQQQQHRSLAGSGHHLAPRMRLHDGDVASRGGGGAPGLGGGKPHPSPLDGPTSYGSSPGAGGYFLDASAGGGGGGACYHGDRDDERTAMSPMWGSPPLRGMSGGAGMMGGSACHGAPGGTGGLGYKDRARQSSLDEGRLGGGSGCGGARSMRCNSDSAQMLVSPGCGGGGGGGGDEFSLDLKKVT